MNILKKTLRGCLLMLLAVSLLLGAVSLPVPALGASSGSLTISGSKYVAVGTKITLKASEKVTWKSSDKSIAKVSSKGVVTGIRKGEAVITAVSEANPKIKQKWTVKVKARPVESIRLKASIKTLDLKKQQTAELEASVSPSSAANHFTWTSSNPSVARVSSKGKVTPVGAGKTKITAMAVDGSAVTASLWITVKDPDALPETLKIKSGTTSIREGAYSGNKTIRDVDLPESMRSIGSKAFANSTVRYVYMPTGISSIADDAFDQCPNAVILASQGSYAREWCAAHGIRTCDPDYVMSITPESKSLTVKNGKTKAFTAKIRPTVSKANLKWSSSDTNIMTVKQTGDVFGKYPGEATLTISSPDGKVAAKVSVSVRANYRALLISESTFAGGVIKRNRGDVRLMKSMLSAVTGPDGGKYKVYSYDDLTESQVYAKITSCLVNPSRNGDVSIFFFASHGDWRSSSEKLAGRLWCKNKKTWLELPTLAKKLAKVKGKVVVLLESCGPGAAVHEFDDSKNASAASEEAVTGLQNDSQLSSEIISAFADADPGLTEYIQTKTSKKGGSNSASKAAASTNRFLTEKFIVMTAAAYHEISYMFGPDNYNLFPVWLTRGVGTGGKMPADTEYGNGDGKLTVKELYKYVYAHTSYKQTPQVYPKNSKYVLFRRK